MTNSIDGRAPGATRIGVGAALMLAVLTVIYTFNFIDRQLLSILQEPVKAELEFTDTQLALMSGLYFALAYSAFGVVAGYIADRVSRTKLLAAGCILWSLFTMLCGLATGFVSMATARVGVAVGEAAGAPTSYSLISSIFKPHQRARAFAIFSLGAPIGFASGAAMGPLLHLSWGWRTAFLVIGAIGLLVGVAFLVLAKEPPREAAGEAATVATASAQAASLRASTKAFFTSRIVLCASIAGSMSGFVNYAMINWNVSFLIRTHGMRFEELAIYYSLMLATSMSIGTLMSGFLVDRLGPRSPKWYALVPMIGLCVSLPFYVAYVAAPNWQVAILLLAVPTTFNMFYLAPVLTVVQNYTAPSQRGMAGAWSLMLHNIIGLAGGTAFTGGLSDYFGSHYGAAEGLRLAMYALSPVYLVAIACFLYSAFALRQASPAG